MKLFLQIGIPLCSIWDAIQMSVIQSPTQVTLNVNDTMTITCTASSYINDDMGFYFFKPGESPKLLMDEPYTKNFPGTRYSGSRSEGSNNFLFTVMNIGWRHLLYACGEYFSSAFHIDLEMGKITLLNFFYYFWMCRWMYNVHYEENIYLGIASGFMLLFWEWINFFGCGIKIYLFL